MLPKWLEVALEELQTGVAEVPGAASNPRIERYLASVGMEPSSPGFLGDETPWCAGFVHWCLNEAGIVGTGRPNARSYQKWGDSSPPDVGSIAVLWRGQRDGWQGHVGFTLDTSTTLIYLAGGNQSNRVSVRAYPRNRVLTLRRPFVE
jgi:uncharacterized protein (TIGR02594 family)